MALPKRMIVYILVELYTMYKLTPAKREAKCMAMPKQQPIVYILVELYTMYILTPAKREAQWPCPSS